MTFLGRRIF